MEWFETLAIEEDDKKPRDRSRNIDDTFMVWNHRNTELDTFLKHINSVKSSIAFTMEKEVPNELPFLEVGKRTDTEWETPIYQKPTHTGQYMNYKSHHHQSTKTEFIKTLVNRSFRFYNTKEGFEKELAITKEDLQRSGYSKVLMEQTLAGIQKERRKEEKPSQPVLTLPYVT
nr:uncharacterized protein LOC111503706 [Leptinotarsa decemlineata]